MLWRAHGDVEFGTTKCQPCPSQVQVSSRELSALSDPPNSTTFWALLPSHAIPIASRAHGLVVPHWVASGFNVSLEVVSCSDLSADARRRRARDSGACLPPAAAASLAVRDSPRAGEAKVKRTTRTADPHRALRAMTLPLSGPSAGYELDATPGNPGIQWRVRINFSLSGMTRASAVGL